MKEHESDARWGRLVELLRPIHEQALATARRLCREPADGDDLYQEAVLRAFEKLPTLRAEAKFRSWFFAVLLSLHRSRHRRAFWKRFVSMDEMAPDDAAAIRGVDAEEQQRADRASRALASLKPEQREAIVLFEIEGFRIEEIAAMQKASVPAVKSRLVRGRANLRRHYVRQGWMTPAERTADPARVAPTRVPAWASPSPPGLVRRRKNDE
jgi:RNA polymerase sigma-70 factor (ECF subfamily)